MGAVSPAFINTERCFDDQVEMSGVGRVCQKWARSFLVAGVCSRTQN